MREQIGLAGKEQAVLPRFRAQGAQTAEHRQHIKNAAAQGHGCALHRGDAYIAEPSADECAVHHIVKGGHKSVVRRAIEPANRRFDTPTGGKHDQHGAAASGRNQLHALNHIAGVCQCAAKGGAVGGVCQQIRRVSQ